MSDEPSTRRQKSVPWQNRYVTPLLLGAGMFAVAASWAVGAIPLLLFVVLQLFLTFALVLSVRQNRL